MANLVAEAPRAKKIRGLSESAVRTVLQQTNPGAAAGDLRMIAEIISVVSNVVAKLPSAKRRELVRAKDQISRRLIEETPAVEEARPRRENIKNTGRVIHKRGAGLGETVSLEDGRRGLLDYASPKPLESWAGPVAGAGEIETMLGIPRSTLSKWQQRGAVVGLLRGERKLAYPVEQFVDGRPLEGIVDLLRMAPDARAAWLWVRQPHGALEGQIPLELLKAGKRADVVKVAERDFV